VSETSQSSKTLGKRKADETRLRRVLVNKDFDTGKSDGKGHYGAQCQYCVQGKWKCGRSATMESHLALHCKGDIPDNLKCHYLIKLCSYCKPISSEKVNEINKALLKAFVCARIAFS
ncbi:19841_t:CDS:2, partial [Racocetra persica]